MVTSSGNQANPTANTKIHMLWQGPYEVTGCDGPTHFHVRLLGDDAVTTVHWKKMRRLAGPGYEPDEEVIASALHDRQRFKVEQLVDWLEDDGEVELLVHWKHHTEEERTWEPLMQLCEDVPAIVSAYVESVDNAVLTQAHADCLAVLAAEGNDA